MEYERPFACIYTGCGMTFDTQENLTTHKRQHLMPLNFDNGSRANTSVDQTPTPTRFIRNCEEVGLFQDLQNVNPFEETFRRANEAGSAGQFIEIDSDVLSGTDDTLHTPPFYPNITGQICAPSSTQTTVDDTGDAPIRQGSEVESNEDLNKKKPQYFDNTTSVSQSGKQTRPKLNIAPKKKNTVKVVSSEATSSLRGRLQLETNVSSYQYPSTRPIAPHPAVQSSGTLSLQTAASDYNQQQNALVHTKQVLRKTLLNQKRAKPLANESASLRKILKTTHVPPQASEVNRQTPEEQQKMKQFRERNRVAASRCREKRKKWIEELETQVKLLQSSNMRREVEVTRLRIELEKCKALLLKHKDCSVTRAENQDITQVLAATPSKVWTDSPDVTYQRVSRPVTQAIVLEEKQSSISTKTSLNATIKVAIPQIPEKVNKTITSAVGTRPLNSVSRNNLSNSSVVTSRLVSGELDRAQSPRDPLLSSTVASGSVSSSPPPGIPIITNVASITLAEEENFMKTAQVINVGNSGKCYLLNVPIAGHPNVPSGELKLGSAQENSDEPWTERVLTNSVQVPKNGIFIIVKNISEIKETEAETSTQTIQVPEMSIMDNEEIPLSLEKAVTPVEEMMVCPETSRDEDDEVVFLKEIPPTRV